MNPAPSVRATIPKNSGPDDPVELRFDHQHFDIFNRIRGMSASTNAIARALRAAGITFAWGFEKTFINILCDFKLAEGRERPRTRPMSAVLLKVGEQQALISLEVRKGWLTLRGALTGTPAEAMLVHSTISAMADAMRSQHIAFTVECASQEAYDDGEIDALWFAPSP